MLLGETFPLTKIDDGGMETMWRQLGGDPVAVARLQSLFDTRAMPLFTQSGDLQHLLRVVGEGVSDEMGLDPGEDLDAFVAGSFIYIATLASLTPYPRVPVHEGVVAEIMEADSRDFMWSAQGALHFEQPPIVELIEQLEEPLDLNAQRRQLALTGAGTVHFVTATSLRVAEEEITHAGQRAEAQLQGALFEHAHPELRDLDAQFGQLGQ